MRPSDEWIDEAARALTEGEPSSGFKAQVLARIEAAESPRRFAWRPVAIASAAIAATVLAVIVSRDSSEVRLPPAPSAVEGPSLVPSYGSPGKPDTTTKTASEVRLPPAPSAVEGPSLVPSYGAPGKPDATREARLPLSFLQRFGLPEMPDIMSAMESEMWVRESAPPPIEVADIEMRSLEIAALDELDPVASGEMLMDSIELAPLTSQFD